VVQAFGAIGWRREALNGQVDCDHAGPRMPSFVARGAEIERASLLKEAWGGSSR